MSEATQPARGTRTPVPGLPPPQWSWAPARRPSRPSRPARGSRYMGQSRRGAKAPVVAVRHRARRAANGSSGAARSPYAGVATRRVTAFRKPGRRRFGPSAHEPERLPDGLRCPGRRSGPRLPADLVPRPTPDTAQRVCRVRGGCRRPARAGAVADRGGPVRAPARLLQRREARPPAYDGGRIEIHAHSDRPLLRQPAPLPTDPTGPYGPAAIGISAFSPVLVYWPQGGPIAIHGTNKPSSIGKPTSNGCLRLGNDDLMLIWNKTPAGTPVVIRA